MPLPDLSQTLHTQLTEAFYQQGTAAAIRHQLGWHAAQLAATPAAAPKRQSEHPPSAHQAASHFPSGPSLSTTLFAWQEPVSPHVAAAKEGASIAGQPEPWP